MKNLLKREKSGIIGITIAFLLGSAAAGPVYAALPVAGVLKCKYITINKRG
ncbi:MAG TPA: hypothetical protein VIO64_15330 [Pseudobacteroides sp.]|uniref:hypothetical protein n=1 Tax=Pseudobacteroides sp. TaxID=1968840 RepID=UPI002F9506F0